MSQLRIRLNSHNYIRVSGVSLLSDDSVPTISTSVAELRATEGGDAITNADISLTLVSGTTDEYEGTFPNTVSLTKGTNVWVWVKLVDSNGNVGEWEDSVVVSGT